MHLPLPPLPNSSFTFSPNSRSVFRAGVSLNKHSFIHSFIIVYRTIQMTAVFYFIVSVLTIVSGHNGQVSIHESAENFVVQVFHPSDLGRHRECSDGFSLHPVRVC